MENDSHLDYDTKNPEVVEMKGLLLEQHCYCVNNRNAPKIDKQDDCEKTLELIINFCTVIDYFRQSQLKNNNADRPSYGIRKIINNDKRNGKLCTCFNSDKNYLLHLAICSKQTNGIYRKNIKDMKSKDQIRELFCNCKNKIENGSDVLIQILNYINNEEEKYKKLLGGKKMCILGKEINEKLLNHQSSEKSSKSKAYERKKRFENQTKRLKKNINTKNENLNSLLAIKKIIILQHCNCFLDEKGFFSIAKLPFKINVANTKGRVLLTKLLKCMKNEVESTIDLINFLELEPNVILPNTFLHYDENKNKDKKKKLQQTSIFGHAIRIIYEKNIIKLYNSHWETILEGSQDDCISNEKLAKSIDRVDTWNKYCNKNENTVEILSEKHKNLLAYLYDMSKFCNNFEFYKKQHSNDRFWLYSETKDGYWLQTKREYLDPKNDLNEIITGINTKLEIEMSSNMSNKLVNLWSQFSQNYVNNIYAILKKLGGDFIKTIKQISNPYNFKKQSNIPPPFDKTKYIEQFSQKP